MTHQLYQGPAESSGRAIAVSVLGHSIFFAGLLLLTSWFQPRPLELGGGPGGGQGGNIITVGLSDRFSGGAGMYKPGLTPQPEAAVPPPKTAEPDRPTPPVDDSPVFEVQKKPAPEKRPPPKPASRPPSPPRRVSGEPPTGVIPQETRPGSGGSPGSGGLGSGIGTGVGVQLGSGTGGAGLDSWYLRQVERRISENWLRSTLGELSAPVEVSVSFEITAAGRIEAVRVQQSSGLGSVDLSAERAVRASNPLPPLPPEFRRRRVRFVAKFEYPPR